MLTKTPYILSSGVYVSWFGHSDLSFSNGLMTYKSLYDFIDEARNYSMVFWLLSPVYSGSLKKIDYPKQICLVHTFAFECF